MDQQEAYDDMLAIREDEEAGDRQAALVCTLIAAVLALAAFAAYLVLR